MTAPSTSGVRGTDLIATALDTFIPGTGSAGFDAAKSIAIAGLTEGLAAGSLAAGLSGGIVAGALIPVGMAIADIFQREVKDDVSYGHIADLVSFAERRLFPIDDLAAELVGYIDNRSSEGKIELSTLRQGLHGLRRLMGIDPALARRMPAIPWLLRAFGISDTPLGEPVSETQAMKARIETRLAGIMAKGRGGQIFKPVLDAVRENRFELVSRNARGDWEILYWSPGSLPSKFTVQADEFGAGAPDPVFVQFAARYRPLLGAVPRTVAPPVKATTAAVVPPTPAAVVPPALAPIAARAVPQVPLSRRPNQ